MVTGAGRLRVRGRYWSRDKKFSLTGRVCLRDLLHIMVTVVNNKVFYVIPATQEAEAEELPEPRRRRLQ